MPEDKRFVINYWKNVNLSFDKELDSLKSNLLFIHNSFEFVEIVDFLNKLLDGNQILYVSLTKTYESIKPYFSKSNQNIFCIDCISKNLFDVNDTNDCIFTSTPSNVGDFSKLMDMIPLGVKPKYIILDSISHFMGYNSIGKENNLTFFSEALKQMSSKSSSKLILLYDEKVSGKLELLPIVSFEKVIRAEVLKDKVYWQG